MNQPIAKPVIPRSVKACINAMLDVIMTILNTQHPETGFFVSVGVGSQKSIAGFFSDFTSLDYGATFVLYEAAAVALCGEDWKAKLAEGGPTYEYWTQNPHRTAQAREVVASALRNPTDYAPIFYERVAEYFAKEHTLREDKKKETRLRKERDYQNALPRIRRKAWVLGEILELHTALVEHFDRQEGRHMFHGKGYSTATASFVVSTSTSEEYLQICVLPLSGIHASKPWFVQIKITRPIVYPYAAGYPDSRWPELESVVNNWYYNKD